MKIIKIFLEFQFKKFLIKQDLDNFPKIYQEYFFFLLSLIDLITLKLVTVKLGNWRKFFKGGTKESFSKIFYHQPENERQD